MVVDHYRDKWWEQQTGTVPWQQLQPQVWPQTAQPSPLVTPSPSIEQLEDFKRDMAEMKALLKRALKYDKDNGEPDCEMEVKKQALRNIAENLGVAIEFP